ncbi:MAG: GTP cyclohydrolase I FolE [Candidatus Dormibacteria bacterium]
MAGPDERVERGRPQSSLGLQPGRCCGESTNSSPPPRPRVGVPVDLVEGLLRHIGEDPTRDGLRRTPERVTRSLRALTAGYGQDVSEVVNGAIFAESYSEMVVVRDIEVYSLCEHHLLPFFGRAHVAYVPNGQLIGLSKLPRVVEIFARRLQVQERLTTQVADALDAVLSPLGVGVVIEAMHLCMMMRGIQKQNTQTVTSSMRGAFLSDQRTRLEFMRLIGCRRGA